MTHGQGLSIRILGELVEDLEHYRYFGLDFISLTIRSTDSPMNRAAKAEI